MSSTYNKSATNTLIAIVFNLLNIVVTLLITPLMINVVGKTEWANYSLFIIIMSTLSFLEVSTQSYFFQSNAHSRLNHKYYNSFRDYSVLIKLSLIYYFLYLLKFYFSKFTNLEKNFVFNNYNIVLLISILRAIISIFKGYFQSENNQNVLNIGQNIFSILRPVILIIILINYYVNIEIVIKVYLFVTIIELIYYFIFYHLNNYNEEVTFNENSNYEVPIVNILFSNLLSVINSNLDKILFLFTSSYLIFGEYNIAASLSALLYLGVNSIITSFAPVFKELYYTEKKRKLILLNITLNRINTVIALFATLFFYFNSELILKMFSKNINSDLIVNCFLILSTTVIINSLNWIPGAISLAANKNSFNIISNLINILIFITIFNVLPHISLRVPISLLISSLLTNIIVISYFRVKIIKFKFFNYYKKTFLLPISYLLVISFLSFVLKSLIFNKVLYLFFFLSLNLVLFLFFLKTYKKDYIKIYNFLQNRSNNSLKFQ